jgi:Holliday junction resolvase RusA-like endonuclease
MSTFDTAGMELLIRSEIPGLPPSVNHYLRRSGKCTYKTREAREWQSNAATILMLENRRKPVYEGNVYVEVQCHTPRVKAIDADNRLKCAQDSVALAGIIKNDNQVMRVTAEKLWTDGKEYTVIEVWKLPEGMYPTPVRQRRQKAANPQ